MAGMTDWLEAPDSTRGIRFAADPDGWDLWSYERLAQATWSAAEQCSEAGVEPGDVVAIVIPTGPAFVAAYFAALLCGATPAPLVPPTFFESHDAYVERTADLLASGIALVATDSTLRELVDRACALAGVPKPAVTIAIDRPPSGQSAQPPAELALFQFTSGSSGRPRAVRVGYDNLEANIRMIREWIGWEADLSGAHWLPLYHDMGLIGCLLTPVVYQRDLSIMRPEQFVMDPGRWLNCFGREHAAFTAGPNFAFSYALSRVKPEQLEGTDFSNWRAAIIGAERLDPGVLTRFVQMLAPHGLRADVFLPAFGMAEATLAVTIARTGQVARAARPRWSTLRFGGAVEIEQSAPIGDPAIGDGAGWLVGCGGPLPGVGVEIVDEAGARVPDDHLGEIRVTGPTVARGYAGSSATLTHFDDDGLSSGDAGFVHDGDLYVIGRLGDAIKVRGKTLYAEDLESKLTAIPDVPLGRCVVLPGAEGEASVVAIVERREGPWVEQAARTLAREAGRGARIRVLAGARGTILRTSSGKPRRQVMWRALLAGELDVTTLHDSAEQALVGRD
jgi:fatty-acyl-CoA synthase